jgi:hypothetical protein
MKTEEEIRQHFTQYKDKIKFKPNPNHLIIVDKWNSKVFKPYEREIFDYISECIDEMIIESLKTYPSYFPMITEINKGVKFQMSDIDEDEHMWYNKFNKWNWNKFENGVIKIADNDNR